MNIKSGFSSFPKNLLLLSNSIRFFNTSKSNYRHCFSFRSPKISYTKKLNLKNLICSSYSTEPNKDKIPHNIKLPPLMNFPRVMWPSIPKALKNTILSYFIIKPYMDLDFDLGDVVLGSKKAVDVVSKKLSSGEDLGQLVSDDIIPVLQSRVSVMSVAQKEWLAIDEKDIYFSFPYQIGIIFNENESDPKRFVEILMVHHSLRGLSEMRERGEEIPMNIGLLPEYRNRICVANYRFIKEFTKGVQDDWTINLLNHFKPSDELE